MVHKFNDENMCLYKYVYNYKDLSQCSAVYFFYRISMKINNRLASEKSGKRTFIFVKER